MRVHKSATPGQADKTRRHVSLRFDLRMVLGSARSPQARLSASVPKAAPQHTLSNRRRRSFRCPALAIRLAHPEPAPCRRMQIPRLTKAQTRNYDVFLPMDKDCVDVPCLRELHVNTQRESLPRITARSKNDCSMMKQTPREPAPVPNQESKTPRYPITKISAGTFRCAACAPQTSVRTPARETSLPAAPL